MNVLLDTHVLLWWRAGNARISPAALAEIGHAGRLLVSPVSFWEVASLARRGRIVLDRELMGWVADVAAEPEVEVAALSIAAAARAGSLDGERFPGDPADRLIYATAWDLHVPLVTADARIRRYAEAARDVNVIW